MTRPTELDQRRADFMERLYQASGRDNSLFTGLWEEFCYELAADYRDSCEIKSTCFPVRFAEEKAE